MLTQSNGRKPASGNVRRVERKRRPVWYIQARLPDGRQINRKLGPAHTGPGRPPDGFFTKRTAQAALRQFPADADRGVRHRCDLRRGGRRVIVLAEAPLRARRPRRRRPGPAAEERHLTRG